MAERLNAYTCDTCGKTIGTVEREPGVTPMFLLCRATPECDGYMSSHMHKSPPVFVTPTFEWRKPTAAEMETCSDGTLLHVAMGGLLLYPVTAEAGRG